MAGFGISKLITPTNNVISKKRNNNSTSTWVGNISFNFKKEVQGLKNDQNVHTYVVNMCKKEQLILTEITGFISNGRHVILKELYPDQKNYFTCFMKTGYGLYLLVLGSKTIHEVRTAGYDNYLKSRVPLILSYDNQIQTVNLKPALRVDNTYSKG